MAADDAALTTFKHGMIMLEREAPAAQVPATAFDNENLLPWRTQVHEYAACCAHRLRVGIAKAWRRVLFSGQREFHANARLKRHVSCAGLQALVAVARAVHLPAASPARAACPHAT